MSSALSKICESVTFCTGAWLAPQDDSIDIKNWKRHRVVPTCCGQRWVLKLWLIFRDAFLWRREVEFIHAYCFIDMNGLSVSFAFIAVWWFLEFLDCGWWYCSVFWLSSITSLPICDFVSVCRDDNVDSYMQASLLPGVLSFGGPEFVLLILVVVEFYKYYICPCSIFEFDGLFFWIIAYWSPFE